MKLIRNILLVILFIQFLIFLYVKLIYENSPAFIEATQKQVIIQKQISLKDLIQNSIDEIMIGARELPQSKEFSLWDEKMIAKLNEEIKEFNNKRTDKNPTEDNITKKTTPKTLIASKVPIQKEIKKEPKEKKNLEQKLITKKVSIKKKVKPKVSMSKKIEKYAKKKLGKKYVWGAVGPKTFDCSGFTKDVFKCTTGITIPRVSRDQAKIGKYIKYKELERGDMVFFDTEKKYSGKVNHVGIYLNNGNFIHASSAKKKVIITNFRKKPFYKKRFLWGRRVVNNPS